MQEVEFRVLGPFEVRVEGRPLELNRRKQRSLLALLLLHAGEVVSTDRLVEELWAGRPPKTAVSSLGNLLSALRKELGPQAVLTRPPGYMLDVDPDRVDLHRFERLVAQAAEGGDAGRRASLLHEALGLWHGPPLADLAFEPFAHVEIARLEELRTAAREELFQAELELGRHSKLVGEIDALVAEHPLRERLRGQLMLALYRSGRQAEALDAYRRARETLVGELGIEPSPELQRLEQSILRHDREIDLPKRAIAEATSGEERRKTVTILFTDIVDSASFGAALDPEVLRMVMRRYFDTVRTVVERHGGTLEKFIGDTAMAVFGVPQMHEDDALRAVRAANELREALIGLNADLERDHGLAIQIRTGINTGEVLAGDAASGQPFATGAAVTVAMRLQQAALPGETLLGDTTRTVLREAAMSEPVEPIDAGGSLGSVQAFRLLALGESTGLRPPTGAPLVGRQEELARLDSAFESVLDKRRSRVVVILGEAGIGKTRLTSEFVSSLGAEATALVGRCVSYGEGATYLPLAEIVRQAAPTRPQATIAALLEGDEHAALIAERMSELTGQAEGLAPTGELFWAVRRFFEALAARRPLVVVLEDVHWAEPTLLDLVEYLGAWTSDAQALVLCIARPELLEKRPGWESSTETITLDPLSGAETGTLLAELAGETELSEKTRARIVAVAEGNALFVEQLLAYITDDVGPDALEEAVPASIEALLASRLDSLEPEDRAVLERAAVVGKDFARSAVRHLSPPETLATVDGRLVTLERRGLIHARRSRVSPEDEFRFHHVLIRDVAYAGITKEHRFDLHERHASWLQQRNEADELIGYHAEQAHRYRGELRPGDPELARLAGWAGDHLAAAGIRAWKRADTPAAVNLLGRASALLPPGIARGEALCELAIALRTAGHIDKAEAALQQAITESVGHDRRLELRARVELAQVGLLVDPEGQSAELLDLAASSIPLFEELGDDRALGRTWLRVAYVVGGVQGDNKARQDAAERALVHYRRSGWSPATCLGELGAALYFGPTPAAEAIRRCEELLEDAVSDRACEANLLVFMGGLEAMRGEFDQARELVAGARSTFEEIGLTAAIANFCGAIGGAIEMANEDYAAAAVILRESCDSLAQMHERALLASRAAELAEALCALRRFEEADQWARLSEEHAAGDDMDAQMAWRAAGAEVKAGTGVLLQAEELARDAVLLAGKTDMLNRRGRTLLVLAEVLRLQGRDEEAAQQVGDARRVFERKGNVVAASRARALLDELVLP
ncbi:MAG TPA: BTAD domain-containing putative transcriptional regulator [Gaiellaceae bacterium]|nr:BTAD domain-containing putative transcriptional regulator [Gaiellaceae bacterium]